MNVLDWNDLRYLLAVARTGSAAAASRELGVSHATVLRRLQALEESVGIALFDRLQSGYLPTEAGSRFVDIGEAFERTLNSTQREVEGKTVDVAGVIHFTTTDSLAFEILPSILCDFQKIYPKIVVELHITKRALDIEKREADVTLRPSREPSPNWVGRRLCRVDRGIYASHSYLREIGSRKFEELSWLLPGGPLMQGPTGEWFRKRVPSAEAIICADSFIALKQFAQAGMGATILPTFMSTPDLALIERIPSSLCSDLWLLTHPHLRHTGRIRALMDYISDRIRAMETFKEQKAIFDL